MFERICEQLRQAAKLKCVRLFIKNNPMCFKHWSKCLNFKLKSDNNPKGPERRRLPDGDPISSWGLRSG